MSVDAVGVDPGEWLHKAVEAKEKDHTTVTIPMRDKGTKYYTTSCLYSDQKKIVSEVVAKLEEWITCDDLATFEPMRMTINGAGGSGKSVVINTLVTIFRRMFGTDDVIKVVAPTGTAAFNVGGETFHHMLGCKVTKGEYAPNTMQDYTRERLLENMKTLLCLLIDERSLISLKDFGTCNRQIAETIFEGGPLSDELFGGLPILVVFGDDYQLPSTSEGAFNVLGSKKIGRMVTAGRQAFLACATRVMELTGNKRMADDKQVEKDLVGAVRVQAELTEKQVQRLLNLHVSQLEKRHGKQARADVEAKAVYLFYTNEKRIRHNLKRLAASSSKERPIAIIKAHNTGTVTRTPLHRHPAPHSALRTLN